MYAGPNTLVGLSKPADASAPFDHDSAIKALLPAYTELLTQLKALGVPEVQMHEPILTTSDASKLKAEFESTYSELSKVGVPINLVSALPSSPPFACSPHCSGNTVPHLDDGILRTLPGRTPVTCHEFWDRVASHLELLFHPRPAGCLYRAPQQLL